MINNHVIYYNRIMKKVHRILEKMPGFVTKLQNNTILKEKRVWKRKQGPIIMRM